MKATGLKLICERADGEMLNYLGSSIAHNVCGFAMARD